MRFLPVLYLAFVSSSLLPPPAMAQAPAAPPPVVSREALRTEYEQLTAYLARKPSMSADDRASIASLLGKIKAAIDAGAMDPLHYAMVAQLAGWIDDSASQETAFAKLVELQPANEIAAAQWIAAVTKRARYEEALGIARSRYRDLTTMPRVALAVAETLIAANRFDEAVTVLDSIGNVAATRPDIGARIVPIRMRAAALAEKWNAELIARASDASKAENAQVELVTTKGTILIELFEHEAPAASYSFVELVDGGQYAGTRFNRRLPGFAVLGGDPNSKPGAPGRPGFGTIGWRIPDEGKRSDRRQAFGGTIGLCKGLEPKPASPGPQPGPQPGSQPVYLPKSAASQFFFLLQPAEFLHDDTTNFTIFGRILDGWETVAALDAGDELVAAQVVRRGAHEYKSVREPELPMPVEMSVPTQAVKPPPPSTQPSPQPGLQPVPVRPKPVGAQPPAAKPIAPTGVPAQPR